LAVAAVVPALRPLFDDARVRDLDSVGVAYHALVRIPLGTVLFEELAFRGALFGALAGVATSMRAALLSSVVFGLYHVRPTLGLLNANDVDGTIVRTLSVTGAVVGTTAAGLLFCLLRTRSDSTVAPIVAHIGTNSFALLASAATG
jgi:membrane protease YdiL (CAAX protease family)